MSTSMRGAAHGRGNGEVDFSGMSLKEIREWKRTAPEHVEKVEKERLEGAFRELRAKKEELGLTDAEARKCFAREPGLGGETPEPGRKYRNPADPEKPWNGKGRPPQGIREHIKGGGKLRDLAI